MKIRTRLLLSLLPALFGGIILISIILCYSWRREISNGFKARLQSSLTTTALLLKTDSDIASQLHQLWDPFVSFRLIEVDSNGEERTLLTTESIGRTSRAVKNRLTAQALNPGFIQEIQESDGRWMRAILPFGSSTLLAEVKASAIDQIFLEHLRLTVFGVALLAVIGTASLYLIAGKISKPMQTLNNSALAIAAGQYGVSIRAAGPRELKELANTLNTMSECLLENINRLKENSLERERSYGEAECARLLQHLMLQKNIDECPSEAIAVKAISFSSASTRGLLIDFPVTDRPELLSIRLAEAKFEGFDGMYQLLTQYKLSKDHPQEKPPFSSLCVTLNRERSTISSQSENCATPYIWSIADSGLRTLKGKRRVAAGDFVFLMNRGFASFFKDPLKMTFLLTKILKYFAQDGIETITTMLHKEIAFATKCKDLREDLHLLCIQILKPMI